MIERNTKKATVLRSTGSWYLVLSEDRQVLDCRIRGKFRTKGLRTTNPVAVGDHVHIENVNGDWMIVHIEDRHNYIIRKSIKKSKAHHIIAANIDQALLIVTMAFPKTSMGFINRFLLTAEAYHIPATIVFNKSDLYENEIRKRYGHFKDIYESAGYKTLLVSALEGSNIDIFRELLHDKVSLLSGHSGAGKSALINAAEEGLNLKTSEVSHYNDKGRHTTTFAEMHPLKNGGFIIDTPGIKEFGVVDFQKWEVSHYFPEMLQYLNQCKFNNCTHTNEPACAVIKAVGEGKIRSERYEGYLNIINDEDVDMQEWQNQ